MKANGQICQDVIEASWSPVLSAQNGMLNMCDRRFHHVVTGVRACILHLCSSGKTARNDDQPSVRYGQIYSLPRSSFTIICYLFLMHASDMCALRADSPLEPEIGEQYRAQPDKFRETAVSWTQKHAKR